MSDFFQHGLISTLHHLNEQSRPLELSSGRGKLGLILPCHYRDLASAALTSIIEVLNSSGLFDLVIVTMNGFGEDHAPPVAHFWSQLRSSSRSLERSSAGPLLALPQRPRFSTR
jgi:hypothetical protein